MLLAAPFQMESEVVESRRKERGQVSKYRTSSHTIYDIKIILLRQRCDAKGLENVRGSIRKSCAFAAFMPNNNVAKSDSSISEREIIAFVAR